MSNDDPSGRGKETQTLRPQRQAGDDLNLTEYTLGLITHRFPGPLELTAGRTLFKINLSILQGFEMLSSHPPSPHLVDARATEKFAPDDNRGFQGLIGWK